MQQKKSSSNFITPDQIRKIWAIWKNTMKATDELLYIYLETNFGVKKLHSLTEKQANSFIKLIRKQANNYRYQNSMTKRQMAFINDLIKDIKWTNRHLENFLLYKFKVSSVRFLTRKQIAGLITILIKIRNNEIHKKNTTKS